MATSFADVFTYTGKKYPALLWFLHIIFYNIGCMCRVSAVASLMPYIAVYMKMLGLTLTETALICGAMPFVIGFTRPMIGGLADKLNAHKQTFIVLNLLAVVFYSSMYFAPHRNNPEIRNRTFDVQMHCGKNGIHVFSCGDHSLPVGSIPDGDDSHPGAAANDLSFNDTVCKSTCNVVMQQHRTTQAQTMSFTRLNRTEYMNFNRTVSIVFGLHTLQPTTMENCRNMASNVTEMDTCLCHNVTSFEVADETWEGFVCEEPTRLVCTTDCHLDEELSFGDSILRDDSQGTLSTDRKGLHFGPVFWSVAIPYFFGELLMQPLFGLTDAMTFGFLGEDRNQWGKQRLFGTVGFAIFGPMSGLLMDSYSFGQNKYAVAFLMYAVFMVASAVCVWQYNAGDRHVSPCPPPARLLGDIVELLTKPEAVVFLSLVLIFGMYFGLIGSFLFWHLKLLGDAPQALLGLCILCSCSVESLVMFFSDRIFRVVSQQNCFAFVCVAYAVRFAGYSLITNPWMVLIIEPIHAVTFGLMYASASTYACKITPPGAHGSVQNIVSALHFCFGK